MFVVPAVVPSVFVSPPRERLCVRGGWSLPFVVVLWRVRVVRCCVLVWVPCGVRVRSACGRVCVCGFVLFVAAQCVGAGVPVLGYVIPVLV